MSKAAAGAAGHDDVDFLSSDEELYEDDATMSDSEESEDESDGAWMSFSDGEGDLLPAKAPAASHPSGPGSAAHPSCSCCVGHNASDPHFFWRGKLGNTARDREEAVKELVMRNIRETAQLVFNKAKDGKQNSGTRPAHIQSAHDHVASTIFSEEIASHGLCDAATRLTGFSRNAINMAIGKRKSSEVRASEFQPRRRAKKYNASDEEFLYELIHEVSMYHALSIVSLAIDN